MPGYIRRYDGTCVAAADCYRIGSRKNDSLLNTHSDGFHCNVFREFTLLIAAV